MTALLTLTRDEAIELHGYLVAQTTYAGVTPTALDIVLSKLEAFIAGTAPERLETQDDPGDIHSVAAPFGHYAAPRECVCGESHTDRATYWQHRQDDPVHSVRVAAIEHAEQLRHDEAQARLHRATRGPSLRP